jgi:hypothetical protein
MRALEARFYARAKAGGSPVTVGHVRWEQGRVEVDPADLKPDEIRPFTPQSVLSKLRFLVECAGTAPMELTRLKSDYWGFVELLPKDHLPRSR